MKEGDVVALLRVGANFAGGGSPGPQFFSTFFNTAVPGGYASEFDDVTPSNGSWNNTDRGNTDNIVP